ncbi:hypothetical protein QBC34DRAFT_489806 [Podospora aff. communis PSN243]|uniref:Alpha-galactosidase A n=1 Tax=Podospora aff. communis PSN243 TaxID=3040156 RepID=A0AAV9H5J5_9PEZI|nr:hypothetical protein QBC34DRAFT_489806 [Podospora aff. communis PSN243]
MASEHEANSNVRLLAALVDPDDKEEADYRFLVDNKHVKYVTVEPGALPKYDRTFAPALIPALPQFPPGDWNTAHIARRASGEGLVFSRVERVALPGCREVERLRQNVYKVEHPGFEGPVVIKFAVFPWQMPYIEAETRAYEWIHEGGIGPRFLGHVVEEGRVVGFIMEYIGGARAAGIEDLEACRRALRQLHDIGAKHGDINKYNFLVTDTRTVLIDFEASERGMGRSELAEEWERLEESLRDASFRGGVGPATVEEGA